MGDRDVVDAAEEYAQHIPVRVISKMLGFPEDDADRFRGFVNHVLEGVALPIEKPPRGCWCSSTTCGSRPRTTSPTPATTSPPTSQRGDGRRADRHRPRHRQHGAAPPGRHRHHVNAIGASIYHLAPTPADRERLVSEPELMPIAMEELLRAYAPVTMARLVKEDMDFNGCPMKKDDWVLLPFPSANRDPEFFDRADEVIIDREVNRHSAFGLGIHRCAGSHLARMELRVALEVWLEHFPVFHLADPDAVRWSGGRVPGPRQLPLRIG